LNIPAKLLLLGNFNKRIYEFDDGKEIGRRCALDVGLFVDGVIIELFLNWKLF